MAKTYTRAEVEKLLRADPTRAMETIGETPIAYRWIDGFFWFRGPPHEWLRSSGVPDSTWQDTPGPSKAAELDDLSDGGEAYVWDGIRRERLKQRINKGYTSHHDDQHSAADWLGIIAHELGGLARAALQPCAPSPYERALNKVAATAVAALASHRRVTGRSPKR
jgi:hypothetical protein